MKNGKRQNDDGRCEQGHRTMFGIFKKSQVIEVDKNKWIL